MKSEHLKWRRTKGTMERGAEIFARNVPFFESSLGDVAALLGSTLAFQDDALQFFEDNVLLVRVINLGIALLFADQEASLFEPLEFALDVTGIFFDKLGQAADVRFEIGIFRINHNDFAAYS